MTANHLPPPVPPMPDLDHAPITHMFRSPKDVFAAIAEKSRRDPELVALAADVAAALDRYLDGALTLREFARCHTPYERFRAIRCWGPLDPHFALIQPVLDDLIALHRDGTSAPKPAGRRFRPNTFPIALRSERATCAACGGAMFSRESQPLVCRYCRENGALE